METKRVTELVLENVEKLLLEGRVENVKKKYPQPTWDVIDELVEVDPSSNNKYLDWMAKTYLEKTIQWFKDNASDRGSYHSWTLDQVPDTSEDPRWGENPLWRNVRSSISDNNVRELRDNLEHFHKNPSKYEIKDINQFKSQKEFDDAVEIAKQKLSRKEMKETGVDKVFEDDRFILMMPKTHKASCRYGARTRWCVTMRGYSGYFENYFGQGPIFFLIDKSQPERQYSPKYMYDAPEYWKVAIHYRPFNGRLDGDGNRALQYARTMSKEEFVDGANVGNTRIDYWNVQDENKKESVVGKYLGGPGRGQSQRTEAILNQLKSVMERYTKKVMADYYDNLGDDTETINKLNELKEKREKLNTKATKIRYKLSRLNDVINNLRYFEGRLETEEGTDDEYREWVNEQLTKSREFYRQMENEESKINQEKAEVGDKIDDIESGLEDKKLVFYDKEKNVPMTR
jgi:hypothetical protein